MAYLLYIPIQRCYEKWRQSGALHFCMLLLLRKLFILLKSLKRGKKVLFYWQHINLTHSLRKVFYIFLCLRGCYGYNLVTHIGNLNLNRLKKGQITQNLKLFNVLEFINLMI